MKSFYSSKKTLNILVAFIIFFFLLIKFLNYEKYELSFRVESRSLDEIQAILDSERIRANPLYNRLFIRRVASGKVEIYLITQNKLDEGKLFIEDIRNYFLRENEQIKRQYIKDLFYINFLINNLKKESINQTNQEFHEYEDLLLKDTNLVAEISKNAGRNYNLGEIKINILNKNFVTINDILILILFILFLYTFFYVFVYTKNKQ
jgi:hypothetical protein